MDKEAFSTRGNRPLDAEGHQVLACWYDTAAASPFTLHTKVWLKGTVLASESRLPLWCTVLCKTC
jgi:hypothetical protein